MDSLPSHAFDHSKEKQEYFQHIDAHEKDFAGLRSRKYEILRASRKNQIYKYCSLETGLKILKSGLLLQSPDNFNDPFDCLAGVNVWNASYRFEADSCYYKRAASLVKRFPQKFQLQQIRQRRDMRASYNFAISCFSERCDNHLMWSHYATNHSGL